MTTRINSHRKARPSALKLLIAGLLAISALGVLWSTQTSAATSEWTRQNQNPKPPGTAGSTMAYDAARRNVVLFAVDGTTWIWDGSVWAKRDLAGPQPGAREGATMGYHGPTGKVVLFGGSRTTTINVPGQPPQINEEALNDTWTWDGNNWAQVCDSCGPSPRLRASMTFDSTRNLLLLFGGFSKFVACDPDVAPCGRRTLGDSWTWNGSSWAQAATSGPEPRAMASMAYDQARQETVLFGGCGGATTVKNETIPGFPANCREMEAGAPTGLKTLSDTWVWNGSAWQARSPSASPTARTGAGAVFDAAGSQVLIFGGGTSPLGARISEMWSWDGSTWSDKSVSSGGPAARSLPLITWDGARAQVLMFGGLGGSTGSALFDVWVYGGLGVASAAPHFGAQDSASLQLSIKGNSFAAGAKVTFSGTGITVNGDPQFVSATELKASIDISTTAALGPRDITVTNPGDRTGRCSACFSVTKTGVAPPVIASVDGKTSTPVAGNVRSPKVVVSSVQPNNTVKLSDTFNGQTTVISTKTVPNSAASVEFNSNQASPEFTLAEGVHELKAAATESSGDSLGESITFTYRLDISAPPAPTVTIKEPINKARQTAIEISGTAERGATIDISVDDSDPSTAPVKASLGAPVGTFTKTMDLSSLKDGTLTASAVATDQVGNVSAPGTRTALKDATPPQKPVIASIADSTTSPVVDVDPSPAIVVENLSAGDTATLSYKLGNLNRTVQKEVAIGANSVTFNQAESVDAFFWGGFTQIRARATDQWANGSEESEPFTFGLAPKITSIQTVSTHVEVVSGLYNRARTPELPYPPAKGVPSGGTTVEIKGTGFTPTTEVKFGDSPAARFKSVKSVEDNSTGIHSFDLQIAAVTPGRDIGAVPVTVITPIGSSAGSGVPTFTFENNQWKTLSQMAIAPQGDCSNAVGGSVFSIQHRVQKPCTARYQHTATVLDDGRVLVAGGTMTTVDGTRSAQIYDPASNSWSFTQELQQPRFSHTATKLDGPACRSSQPPNYCGGVLVVGGEAVGGELDSFGTVPSGLGEPSVELYDPATSRWKTMASLHEGRFAHTATLLDGPPCQGDHTHPSYCGKVLVVGGTAKGFHWQTIKSVEMYDPQTDSWTIMASLQTARSDHTASFLPDGRILVAGGLVNAPTGSDFDSLPTGDSEILDLSATTDEMPGRWSPTGALKEARFAHSVNVLEGPLCNEENPPGYCGKALAAGGMSSWSPPVFLRSTEIYDPNATDKATGRKGAWNTNSFMNVSRALHSATALPSGKLLVAGSGMATRLVYDDGLRAQYRYSAEIFDPLTSRWTMTGGMNFHRAAHSAVVLDGPQCDAPFPPENCGVMISGGAFWGNDGSSNWPYGTKDSELYVSGPDVAGLVLETGPSSGGTEVTIRGMAFTSSSQVTFGGVPATDVEQVSSTEIRAVTPPQPAGPVEVKVINGSGTPTETAVAGKPFVYGGVVGLPGAINGLAAESLSETEIKLSFLATKMDSGFENSPPATDYIIKEDNSKIRNEADFNKANSLCSGDICKFSPQNAGDVLSVKVSGLSPGTRYHYAVRAVNVKGQGPRSESLEVRTLGTAPAGQAPSQGVATSPNSNSTTQSAIPVLPTPRTQPLPLGPSVLAGPSLITPANPIQALNPAPKLSIPSVQAPEPEPPSVVQQDTVQRQGSEGTGNRSGWVIVAWALVGAGYCAAAAIWWFRYRKVPQVATGRLGH